MMKQILFSAWKRLLVSMLLGYANSVILILVGGIAAYVTLPCSGGWLCTEVRSPTLLEWLLYFTITLGMLSVPSWGVYVVAGIRSVVRAYLAGVLTTAICLAIMVVTIDNSTDTAYPLVVAIWVLVTVSASIFAAVHDYQPDLPS